MQGDARQVLPSFPSVDHIVTDPPYNEETHTRARSLKGGGSDIEMGFAYLSDFAFVLDMLQVSRRWVLAFCALEDFGKYKKRTSDKEWVRAGIWDRPDGTPQLSGDRPGQAAEGIAIMHRSGRKRWNRGGKRGMWRHGVERTDRSGHPTQKPLPLMIELIEDFTEPGDLILDPFCGSGTTLVAAIRTGRRAIGVDLEAEWIKVARDRCIAEETGSTLGALRSGQEPLFK